MKYEYMKESEQILQYFQFPKFLLKLPISQNAKFLYMILYDRARISRKNSWIDKYGNVYLIFPIEELSSQIGKCKSSVKIALKELDEVGLLVRRSGGFSKPNHLYVRIPSDEIGLQPDEKMTAIESEKQPSSSRKNGCAGVGNVAPSKVTEKYKRNKYHEVNYCYGEGESL
ncbi:replication initiator protein A [Emergencia sp.]|uniref:replication initiator protein A n=1 Tax=Emergencia sp. TaxID=1926557 RepID=UPI003AEF5CFC